MDIEQQRYEYWINGKSFKDLAAEYDVTVDTIAKNIAGKIKYRLSDYLINNSRGSHFGDVCVIKEVDEAVKKYKYKKDEDPCYCLYCEGIYKRNEDLFRKLAKALDAKSLKVVEENRYRKLIQLYSKDYQGNDYTYKGRIEAALNRVPESFNLKETKVFGEKDIDRMYGIYEVPVLTINHAE